MDFRLKVFQSVASNRSFTRASKELRISQPAISKHIQELESLYKVRLFDRVGPQIQITPEGELLLSHAERILDAFKWLEYEMNQLTNRLTGELRLGASSTLSQYILPPVVADFIKKNPEIKLTLINGNSLDIENALLKKTIDLGMVEGNSRNSTLHYTPFLKDEIVAVCSTKGALTIYEEITIDQLKKIPVVIRENGSGTLEILQTALKQHQLKLTDLKVLMQLGSTESIKLFLENCDCIGFVSIHAIAPQIAAGKFKVIEIKDFNLNRVFQFIQLHGETSGIAQDFIRFAKRQTGKA